MGWLSALFSTPHTIDKAVDVGEKITTGIISGIDKCFYTNEEKAEALQKGSETLLNFWKTISAESTEQSIARRELAKMVFKSYFSMLFMTIAVYGFNAEYAKFIFEVANSFATLVLGVGAIYFGPHQLQKVLGDKGTNGKE